jgi:hypothetical protein
MSGLLSAISGQFTKSLILGALFPAALFVILWTGFVAPLLPPDLTLPAVDPLGAESPTLTGVVAILLIGVLLYSLDVPLIQLYEGYPWRDSVLGRCCTRAQVRVLRRERRRTALLFELTARTRAVGFGRLVTAWGRSQRKMLEFPGGDD